MTEQEWWDKLEAEAKEAEANSPHTEHCHEYWDRGLNCPHIPQHEAERLRASIEAGDGVPADWGQYD